MGSSSGTGRKGGIAEEGEREKRRRRKVEEESNWLKRGGNGGRGEGRREGRGGGRDEIQGIDIRFHFIKGMLTNGVINMYFVNTEYQLANIFTKALGREIIEFLINKLGMRSFLPKTLKQLADEVDE
ncbi:hypothetical protein Tco_0565485 [Tanacetum coccineum]